MMHVRVLALLTLLLGTGTLSFPVQAQRTGDQARLIFTVSAGWVGGKDLWLVDKQPVRLIDPADTLQIGRDIRSTIGLGFSGTYFPGENLGFSGEGFLIGLGYEDSCRQVFASGSPDVADGCRSIQGATKDATAVILSVGPVLRINSRKLLSPYIRGNLGLVFSNQSSLRTIGQLPGGTGEILTVYVDDHESRVEPSFALGAGFTAAVAQGYQLRWEMRDNIVGVQKVSGAAAQAPSIPPHELEYKHLLSMTIGFDVVLERRRGRRY
jgi:hypothetical protein